MKWDNRFLDLCHHVKRYSKDPYTQVGCVIVRPDRTVASTGYNGFARGVCDDPERYKDRSIKYDLVLHAEVNAILHAKESLEGYTLYSSLSPCAQCSAMIIQSGITRVVSQINDPNRWQDQSHQLSRIQFKEAGVQFDEGRGPRIPLLFREEYRPEEEPTDT